MSSTSATTTTTKTTTTKSLNQKIQDLDDQIDWFYGDDFDLAAASEKYKQAKQLAEDIEKDLNSLKNDIEIVDKDFSNS